MNLTVVFFFLLFFFFFLFFSRFCDRYLQSASYGRLKNLTVGYTIPKNLTTKWGISRLRLYVTGENLLTITPLNDAFDPETLGGMTCPINRKVAIGFNLTL